MYKAYLLIGGNEGDANYHLEQARQYIDRFCGIIMEKSHVYVTAAWGITDQASFLNQALLINTAFKASVLMRHILEGEKALGRIRMEKYGPRIIDIDILFFSNLILDEPSLKIPHPQLPERRFALVPMDELAPDLIHPILHKTIHQLLLDCTDPLEVQKLLI